MFICISMDLDNDIFTTVDTSDFSVEDLSQETILEYQSSSGDKVKMFDSEILFNDDLGEDATKAVLYKIEDGMLYILVLHIGTDYTLYAELELESEDIELALDEDENLIIFDTESGDESVIPLVKEDN